MSSTIDLLDKYKNACTLGSDNACAVKLGVSRQAVSKWRNGENHPDAETVAQMCDATGEPLAFWLPLIEAERARTPGSKKVWLRLAETASAVALMVSFGLLNVHRVSHAVAVISTHNPITLSIM